MAKGSTYDPAIHHRRSIRLRGHDYSGRGVYFATILTKDHRNRLVAGLADGLHMPFAAASGGKLGTMGERAIGRRPGGAAPPGNLRPAVAEKTGGTGFPRSAPIRYGMRPEQ